ncbi:hypothetical protein K2Z83_15560 [Oscillochloris sp. ZM17-4]|uniref:hypothetical protein n=1 Tax=Oscillochloris sp. ZM17-4 TaxID=2866714 RepID=UPI001C73AF8A|nr:hypothetical protein [Oscillochloris sp. ZM17-4]MBX0329094.1 hypothetical protein [Oscillochloris sp. ZM17-4]
MTTTTLHEAETLETLRQFADLEGCFDLLDEHPNAAPAAAHEALFHDGSELAVRFAIAVIRERMGVELRADEELSEMAIIEILDPAKGYPTLETRAYAALIALALPGPDEERRNNAYFASYLLRYDPGIGLAVSLNAMRASHGLGPTGW